MMKPTLRKGERARKTRLRWLLGTACALTALFAAMAAVNASRPEPPISFDYDKLPRLGAADALVKIVEIGDFKCPACRYFGLIVKPQLERDYIRSGTVALYFFWKFYDAVYLNQGDEREIWATPGFLVRLAQSEGLQLDEDVLKRDIIGETYADEVIEQNRKAEKLVTATPTLFVNGVKFTDFSNYEALRQAIDEAGKKAGQR